MKGLAYGTRKKKHKKVDGPPTFSFSRYFPPSRFSPVSSSPSPWEKSWAAWSILLSPYLQSSRCSLRLPSFGNKKKSNNMWTIKNLMSMNEKCKVQNESASVFFAKLLLGFGLILVILCRKSHRSLLKEHPSSKYKSFQQHNGATIPNSSGLAKHKKIATTGFVVCTSSQTGP